MSRRGNCWDNAPQESFFGHMKDHLMDRISTATDFHEVQAYVDDYMDYYNNERYVWDLAYLSPNEYYDFVTTGKYPLDIPNPPEPPKPEKKPEELGVKKESEAENLLKINVAKKGKDISRVGHPLRVNSTFKCP